MPTIRRSLLFLAAAPLVAVALNSAAAEFGVTPLRVDLDNANRTGLLTVSNEGSVPLKVNIKLMRWTQNAIGEEQYADSDLLLFFPRSMTIDPMDKRVVRIGLKAPLPAKRDEQAFRLYLEEAPVDGSGAPKGQVQFRFRFGIPIFVAPSDVKTDTVIESAEVAKGKLMVNVTNRGTNTVRFETFTATAANDWQVSNSGLYHFPGTSRRYEVDIPPEKCRGLRTVKVELKSEKLSLGREVPVTLENCATGK